MRATCRGLPRCSRTLRHRVARGHDGHRADPSYLRRSGPPGRARPRWTLTHVNHTFAVCSYARRDSNRHRPMSAVPSPQLFTASPRATMDIAHIHRTFARSGPKGSCEATVDIDSLQSHLPPVFVRSPQLQSTSPHVKRTFAAAVHRILRGHDGCRPYPSQLRRTLSRGRPRPRLRSPHIHRASPYLITRSPRSRLKSPDVHRTLAATVHRFIRGHDGGRPISLIPSPHPFAGSSEATIEITSCPPPHRRACPHMAAVRIEITRYPSHLHRTRSQGRPGPRWRSR